MQLKRLQLSYHKISHVFISHLHGDHYLGLMGLLFTLHLQGRTQELHIFSPRGLDEIILLHLKYSRSVLNFDIHFHTLDPQSRQIIFDDAALTVETIPLVHKIGCTGFLFREKLKPHRINKASLPENMLLQHIVQLKSGADVMDESGKVIYLNKDYTLPPKHSWSYAYFSDTSFETSLAEQIQGVDVLYHEATFLNDEIDKAEMTKHSTAAQAASMAKLANVKNLIIGHFSARYRELEPVLAEAKAIFPNTSLALEGKIFELDV